MALIEKQVFTMAIKEDGVIERSIFDVVEKDGIEFARSIPNTRAIVPGADVTGSLIPVNLESQAIQDIVAVVHTQAVIDSYKASLD